MNYLFKGSQTQQRLDLLLSFCKIKSDDIKSALSDYLVRGIDKKSAAVLNGVPAPNFSRALSQLNSKAEVVEQIKELDWQKR
ncbi:MAG: PapB/FocB family fimbrial expression transcriptional regulator [Pseudoalteromonas spongiae]